MPLGAGMVAIDVGEDAQGVMGAGQLGVQAQGAAQLGLGLGVVALTGEQDAESGLGGGVAGVGGQGLAVGHLGEVILAAGGMDGANLVEGLGVVAFLAQGANVFEQGAVAIPPRQGRVAFGQGLGGGADRELGGVGDIRLGAEEGGIVPAAGRLGRLLGATAQKDEHQKSQRPATGRLAAA